MYGMYGWMCVCMQYAYKVVFLMSYKLENKNIICLLETKNKGCP